MLSSTPVTVIVCAMFQLAVVNVIEVALAIPSAGLVVLRLIVTFAVGCVFSITLNCVVPPASVVNNGESGVIVTPALSLSVLINETSVTARPL